LRTLLSIVLSLAALVAVGYIVLGVLLYVTQESSIFFPRPNNPDLRTKYAASRVEIASPSTTLEGWWAENPDVANDIVLIYFGGNAEDVLYSAETASRLHARRMLVTNYRGYGGNPGKPSQDALYEDGLAVYEYVLSKGVRADQIVVVGRSLGSGIASMLAGAREVRAAILITPFDSLSLVAARHYPYLPVRLLLRHPFQSEDWARTARAPALVLAAANDDIIPPSHAQRLADAWAGEVQVHVLAPAGHNDIELHPDYYRLINEFLAHSR
jgi:fermentation-respiration switch protein FrsA (DUF1100 family)